MTTLRAIQLPTLDNIGNLVVAAHREFRFHLLEIAGGYNRRVVKGAWRDNHRTVFRDTLVEYQVACTPDQWKKIVSIAKTLFPDQASIFTATLGVAHLE